VSFDGLRLHLSDLLAAIQRLGYTAHPYDPERSQRVAERERHLLLRQLGVAGLFGMQVMMVAIALYMSDTDIDVEFRRLINGLNLLLTAPVVTYSALAFYRPAWRSLMQKMPGMDLSVSLGILLAFFGSAWATLADRGETYFDSVTMFVFLLLLARYLELMARQRATSAGEELSRQQPAIAVRLFDDAGVVRSETIPVVRLVIGDRVLVRPGEVIPADGEVIEGASTVNEALLTGESMPLAKQPGSPVIGGSINIDSPLTIRVARIGDDSVLARILHALDHAQAERPRATQIADRWAAIFVLTVLAASAVVALHGVVTNHPTWFGRVLAMLVVTCPCALSLATPAAVVSAIGALLRRGVLVVHGQALETLARATHFAFDKTGTLTCGEPELVGIDDLTGLGDREILRVAAALESCSEHPLARTIIDANHRAGGGDERAANVVNNPGRGIEGEVQGRHWRVGTAEFVLSGREALANAGLSQRLESRAGTLVLLAEPEKVHAIMRFEDRLRPAAKVLMDELAATGIKTMLLTGDRASVARQLAAEAGIGEWRAELQPQDKLEALRALQVQGAMVAMAGDGINDAPALACAQVSVAMGTGATLARSQADFILLGDRLDVLASMVSHARRTLAVIRQNLIWAVAYNLVALPFAAAGWVSPWAAAVGMSLSSLLVVGNALRLARV